MVLRCGRSGMDEPVYPWMLCVLHLRWMLERKCCFGIRVLCCLVLTLLLRLLLQWGEGTEQCLALPIREPGCSGAPLPALRFNKLYPEIQSPPPHISSQYFLSPLLLFASSCFSIFVPSKWIFWLFTVSLWSTFSVCTCPIPKSSCKQSLAELTLRELEPHGSHSEFTWQSCTLLSSSLMTVSQLDCLLCFVWSLITEKKNKQIKTVITLTCLVWK